MYGWLFATSLIMFICSVFAVIHGTNNSVRNVPDAEGGYLFFMLAHLGCLFLSGFFLCASFLDYMGAVNWATIIG